MTIALWLYVYMSGLSFGSKTGVMNTLWIHINLALQSCQATTKIGCDF